MNVAIIGGNFGIHVILPAISGLSNLNLIGVSPSSFYNSNKKLIFNQKQIPVISNEFILEAKDIDLIFVAVPPIKQTELVLELLKKKSHLFVEKPLSSSFDDALVIFNTSAERPYKYMVDFTFFGVSQVEYLLNIIKNTSVLNYNFTWNCKSRSFIQGIDSWRFNSESGGGALNNLVSHFLALFNIAFGSIKEICSEVNNHHNKNLVYTDAKGCVELKHSNGIQGSFVFDVLSEKRPEISLIVNSEDYKITLVNLENDFFNGFKLYINEIEIQLANENIYPNNKYNDSRIVPVKRLINKFIFDINESNNLLLDFKLGLNVQKAIDAIKYSSNKGGMWVNL